MREHGRFGDSPIIKRPRLEWPGGARLALWVAVNVEHYHFDKAGLAIHSAPERIPDVLNYGWRDYGPRVGFWRILKALDKYRVRACLAINSEACQRRPVIIEEAVKRNWEFIAHGTTNSEFLPSLGESEERAAILSVAETIAAATGARPRGWLGPGLAESYRTPDLLAEHGFAYVCDWCNDDQPYAMNVRQGRLLSMPYAVELNDIQASLAFGYPPETYARAICEHFDVLYEEGGESGRVMALPIHDFILGVPHRIRYLEKILEHITRHDGVWIATAGEIADWYQKRYVS
jgi:peptidoglycan/xylan/chitin deacetylase (PgdA/CDA1 family)